MFSIIQKRVSSFIFQPHKPVLQKRNFVDPSGAFIGSIAKQLGDKVFKKVLFFVFIFVFYQ